jgi:hypothetical protein
MMTVECFHAASLGDIWDQFDNGVTRMVAGPLALFVSQAPPDTASADERRDPHRHAPQNANRLTVSM